MGAVDCRHCGESVGLVDWLAHLACGHGIVTRAFLREEEAAEAARWDEEARAGERALRFEIQQQRARAWDGRDATDPHAFDAWLAGELGDADEYDPRLAPAHGGAERPDADDDEPQEFESDFYREWRP